MKKYLLGVLFLSILSCGRDDDPDNLTNPLQQTKIQTLTIQDEDIQNGVASLYEKLDFKFEYNQGRLEKVWDIHNNYTENLTYNSNNQLSDIVITGYSYPQLANQNIFNVKRHLTYDSSNRLVKSEALENLNFNYNYVTFEYPSSNLIIARKYGKNSFGDIVNLARLNIYIENQNVTKVEWWYDGSTPPMLRFVFKYEYDQKINPNSLIDSDRILALPEYSFNVFKLQDYSQISKNNVIKKQEYTVDNGVEILTETTNLYYSYQNNNLPESVYLKIIGPNNTEVKVSAIYGY